MLPRKLDKHGMAPIIKPAGDFWVSTNECKMCRTKLGIFKECMVYNFRIICIIFSAHISNGMNFRRMFIIYYFFTKKKCKQICQIITIITDNICKLGTFSSYCSQYTSK